MGYGGSFDAMDAWLIAVVGITTLVFATAVGPIVHATSEASREKYAEVYRLLETQPALLPFVKERLADNYMNNQQYEEIRREAERLIKQEKIEIWLAKKAGVSADKEPGK